MLPRRFPVRGRYDPRGCTMAEDYDPFTEIGCERSPLDRARDTAVQMIAVALQCSLSASSKTRQQRSACWQLLWQPLDAERKLAPYPADPLRLRRWPALIHDVRRHARRALPPNRKSRDAWPPNGHVIWQEALGILLGRKDVAEATSGLRDMPSNEFAKLVKHAWLVGPRLECMEPRLVSLSDLWDSALLPLPIVGPEWEQPSAPVIWNWSITRLKTEEELAARRSLKRALGMKVWRSLIMLPLAKLSPMLREALADELGTRRLSAAEKRAVAEAKSKGLLGGPGEQLRWSITSAERSALRQVVTEVRQYGRPVDFIKEHLIRNGKPVKLRPRPDHPVRQDPRLREALRQAHGMFARFSSDPLGELVELLLSRVTLRIVWATQDWDRADDEGTRKAARSRLREMVRRQLSSP